MLSDLYFGCMDLKGLCFIRPSYLSVVDTPPPPPPPLLIVDDLWGEYIINADFLTIPWNIIREVLHLHF